MHEPKKKLDWIQGSNYFLNHHFRSDNTEKKDPIKRTKSGFPILVIGAGPAGLAVMRALKEAGIDFEAVEQNIDVGGMWNQKNQNTVVYDGLMANASKATMHLGDFATKKLPQYFSPSSAYQYLVNYAEEFNLKQYIEFQFLVKKIEKTESGTWRVEFYDEKTGTLIQKEYRATVIATGLNSLSNIKYPKDIWKMAEENGILVIHSSAYRNPKEYKNKRVAILGCGNSGLEIATEISKVAAKTFLCVRTTPWIVPLKIGGIPSDAIFRKSQWVPYFIQMKIFSWLQKKTVGHPVKDLGFHEIRHELLDQLPGIDRGIVRAVLSGSVLIRSNIKEVKEGKIVFELREETPEQIDQLIFATGYRRSYPFVPSKYLGFLEGGPPLLFHLFHPREVGLLFMQEVVVPQGSWEIFWEQAQTIAAYFKAEAEEGKGAVDEFNLHRQSILPSYKGKLFKQADQYHVDPFIYKKLLQDLRNWFSQN